MSKAELERLLDIASGGGCVSLVRDVAASPGSPLAPYLGEDPTSSEQGMGHKAPVSGAVVPQPGHIRALVTAWHGYAVASVEYETVVQVHVPQGSRTAVVDLPGPMAATLTVSREGGLVLCCTASRKPLAVAPPKQQPPHFCALKDARVEVVYSGGGKSPECASGGSMGEGGSLLLQTPLELTLPLALHLTASKKATITVTRTYLWSLSGEGHTLCLALPTTPPPGSSSHPTNLPSTAPSVRCEVMFFDEHLGGVSGVISPTREFRMWAPPSGAQRLVLECQSTEGNTPPLFLIEPRNVGELWEGLGCGSGGVGGTGHTQQQQHPLGLLRMAAAFAPTPPLSSSSSGGGGDTVSLPLLSSSSLPRHIAVIMDGNGRWAQRQGKSRSQGHHAGVATIRSLIRALRRLRIPYLTLYAFSAQNWSRPPDEVQALMSLLADFVATDLEEFCANGVRLIVNGEIGRLPREAREGLSRIVSASASNSGLVLCLALSYGGREEIAGAAIAACRAAKAGLLDPNDLTPEAFREFLPHPHVPDPDLLIRTSGEMRVSNFLLWQIAYSELHVTQALWPDFDDKELVVALRAFKGRERRFGKTGEQAASDAAAAAAASAGTTGAGAVGDGGSAAAAIAAASFNGGGGKAPSLARKLALGLWFFWMWCGSKRRGGGEYSTHEGSGYGGSGGGRRGEGGVLRCLVCTVLPLLALVASLSLHFLLAPLALRLGLIDHEVGLLEHAQSRGDGGGSGTCSLGGEGGIKPSPTPCAMVLLDSRICSFASLVLQKTLAVALHIKQQLYQ